MKNPLVSIVIPTLNAASVLEECLRSISIQTYPKERVEIIVVDGGSVDATLNISKKYGAKVLENKLRTAEAGKAVGVRAATGEFIALIDSDNILPTETWLSEMIAPLSAHPEAVGSEPWEYTWRKQDGFITRYCALIGMNDPLVYFLGNYDRMNLLTGKWTEVDHEEEDFGGYIYVTFDGRGLPTIGANGTVFRTEFIRKNLTGDYLFDIDVLAAYIRKMGKVNFIKAKNGIIHTYCESNIGKFAKKQRRRVQDYLFHKAQGNRSFDWEGQNTKWGLVKFVGCCVLIIPLFYQALKGFLRKRDAAWFFHPISCELTFFIYTFGILLGKFKSVEMSREGWNQ